MYSWKHVTVALRTFTLHQRSLPACELTVVPTRSIICIQSLSLLNTYLIYDVSYVSVSKYTSYITVCMIERIDSPLQWFRWSNPRWVGSTWLHLYLTSFCSLYLCLILFLSRTARGFPTPAKQYVFSHLFLIGTHRKYICIWITL